MIVFGHDTVAWVAREMGYEFQGEAIGLGLKKDGDFVAGVVYHDRQPHNVHATIVAKPGSLTKRYMRAIFEYPFDYLKVRRITACVRISNKASAALAQRMGFVREGCQRCGYQDGEDKLIFGMLREECKWIS